MKPKPLDEFEMDRIVEYMATTVYQSDGSLTSDAVMRRLRSRLTRFVLSHPDVTPAQAKMFKRVALKGPPDNA